MTYATRDSAEGGRVSIEGSSGAYAGQARSG